MQARVRSQDPAVVPPGLKLVRPAPSVILPPSEPSPLHEAILAWLDCRPS